MRSTISIRIIATMLVIAALALGREFFIPLALALCFHALLRPVLHGLEALHIPTALGAAIVVLGVVGLLIVAGFGLSGPVGNFVEKAPQSIRAAREKLRTLGEPMTRMSDAAEGKTGAAKQGAAAAPTAPSGTPAAEPPVPSLVQQAFGRGTLFITGLVEVLLLLFLMLAGSNILFRKIVHVLPRPDEKRTATDVMHQTQSIVARYLLVTAAINIGQSIAVGLAMWAIGMPDPLIWGLLTFVLEFIPYLGGIIMVGLLVVTGITVFSGLGQILLGPGIYLVISAIQNNVVSPYAYGDRLKLNPLAVIIAVMFWWFVWGIPGAFLAIPITATLKVLGDQVPRLAPVAELLGE